MRITITTENADEIRALLGINDAHARMFRRELNVAFILRKGSLQLEGDEDKVEAARAVADEILARYRTNGHVEEKEVALLLRGRGDEPAMNARETIVRNRLHRNVAPRTDAQWAYVEAMLNNDVVFSIGPAGTGKTYLAVAMAVRMLREGTVQKIVLTRPAVEAGEKLGFLPGTFEAKVNPYLRPLYDALYDLIEPAQIRKFSENDVFEIVPLAYMRGRTLSDAFIILDEAQNTTTAQMKMFLTRMGEGSRMVVTGDVTQIDLPPTVRSGLKHAEVLLQGLKGIAFSYFDRHDIIRHKVVQKIVDAYQREDAENDGREGR
ncbi:MAG: PhoH family protein [Planctomycetota bacterium]